MWMLLSLANGAPDYAALAKDPRDTLLYDAATPAGFRIVALSHLSEACAADGDVGCVERAYRAAVHPQIRSMDPAGKLGPQGLYLSHLAVILGKCAEVKGRCDASLHSRVVEHLARGSVKDGVIASFPGDLSRYPADQAVTLYGIFLHDRTRGTQLLPDALSAYHQRVDPTAGASWWALPASEVAGSQEWSAVPRGCALAWTVRYLAPVEPDYARSLWVPFKKYFYVQVGPLSGFREWPLGEDRGADADSGPIILGVGAAATAFGIAAAHVLDDELIAAQLEGTERLVRLKGHPAGDSALAVAITAASQRM